MTRKEGTGGREAKKGRLQAALTVAVGVGKLLSAVVRRGGSAKDGKRSLWSYIM